VVVRRLPDGRLVVQPPQYRDPRSDKWLPCIGVPDELVAAIGSEVLAAMLETAA
jgi:hypothetical protein